MTFTSTTIRKLRELGLPQEQFDAVLAIFEEATLSKPKKKGCAADRQERGTRLPADWALPAEYREWALAVGLRGDEVAREAEKFRNYWRAQPGVKGIKLDWRGTFRNWCISTLERAGRPIITPPDGNGDAPMPEGPQSFSDDTWRAIAKRYKSTGTWNLDYGPEPGRMDCIMPANFL